MDGHYTVERDQIEDFVAAKGVREWVALSAYEDGEQAVLEVGTRDLDEPAAVVLTAAHLRDMASRFMAMADGLEQPSVQPGNPDLDLQLEALLDDARLHGQDSEDIEYEVGDLQGLVWSAWRLMGDAQRRALLGSEGAKAIRDIMQDPDESDEGPAAVLRVDA